MPGIALGKEDASGCLNTAPSLGQSLVEEARLCLCFSPFARTVPRCPSSRQVPSGGLEPSSEQSLRCRKHQNPPQRCCLGRATPSLRRVMLAACLESRTEQIINCLI